MYFYQRGLTSQNPIKDISDKSAFVAQYKKCMDVLGLSAAEMGIDQALLNVIAAMSADERETFPLGAINQAKARTLDYLKTIRNEGATYAAASLYVFLQAEGIPVKKSLVAHSFNVTKSSLGRALVKIRKSHPEFWLPILSFLILL